MCLELGPRFTCVGNPAPRLLRSLDRPSVYTHEICRDLHGGFSLNFVLEYRLCCLVVRIPDHGSGGPGSIPSATKFSKK
jgi:hypothetical protein